MDAETKRQLAEHRREKREAAHARRLARQARNEPPKIDRAAAIIAAARRFKDEHDRWPAHQELRDRGML